MQSGIIMGLKYHTVGGVITPGSPILDIVPQNEELVIEARIKPQDIDIVHKGLHAQVRLSAYKSKQVPILDATVIFVSPDHFTDPNSGDSYFSAQIKLKNSQFKKLKNVKLYPGMPAETYILTGNRTFLHYLFSPIMDSFEHAFRED